jgi:hypothetical protein
LKDILTQIGNVWARILFSVFYFVIVTPFGLAVRFLSDPLQLKRRNGTSHWQPKTPQEHTLEEARRQF